MFQHHKVHPNMISVHVMRSDGKSLLLDQSFLNLQNN